MKLKTHRAPLLISIFSAALLMAGSTTIAKTSGVAEKKSIIKITTKIVRDGKVVSSPIIITPSNSKAMIVLSNQDGSQDLRMGLVARNATMAHIKNAVELNYDVQIQDGEGKIHSKPHVIVAPNQEGIVKIASNSNHKYEMRILAQRQ